MEHRFDLGVAPATVLSDLISEDFLRAFASEVGVEVDSLECATSGDRSTATMHWRFSTAKPGIPELARKLLPDEVRLSWAQEWGSLGDAGAHGTLEVNLLGKPRASSKGTSHLRGTAHGATLTTSTKSRSALPFPLGRKVESMVDKDLVGWILSVQARVLARRHPS